MESSLTVFLLVCVLSFCCNAAKDEFLLFKLKVNGMGEFIGSGDVSYGLDDELWCTISQLYNVVGGRIAVSNSASNTVKLAKLVIRKEILPMNVEEAGVIHTSYLHRNFKTIEFDWSAVTVLQLEVAPGANTILFSFRRIVTSFCSFKINWRGSVFSGTAELVQYAGVIAYFTPKAVKDNTLGLNIDAFKKELETADFTEFTKSGICLTGTTEVFCDVHSTNWMEIDIRWISNMPSRIFFNYIVGTVKFRLKHIVGDSLVETRGSATVTRIGPDTDRYFPPIAPAGWNCTFSLVNFVSSNGTHDEIVRSTPTAEISICLGVTCFLLMSKNKNLIGNWNSPFVGIIAPRSAENTMIKITLGGKVYVGYGLKGDESGNQHIIINTVQKARSEFLDLRALDNADEMPKIDYNSLEFLVEDIIDCSLARNPFGHGSSEINNFAWSPMYIHKSELIVQSSSIKLYYTGPTNTKIMITINHNEYYGDSFIWDEPGAEMKFITIKTIQQSDCKFMDLRARDDEEEVPQIKDNMESFVEDIVYCSVAPNTFDNGLAGIDDLDFLPVHIKKSEFIENAIRLYYIEPSKYPVEVVFVEDSSLSTEEKLKLPRLQASILSYYDEDVALKFREMSNYEYTTGILLKWADNAVEIKQKDIMGEDAKTKIFIRAKSKVKVSEWRRFSVGFKCIGLGTNLMGEADSSTRDTVSFKIATPNSEEFKGSATIARSDMDFTKLSEAPAPEGWNNYLALMDVTVDDGQLDANTLLAKYPGSEFQINIEGAWWLLAFAHRKLSWCLDSTFVATIKAKLVSNWVLMISIKNKEYFQIVPESNIFRGNAQGNSSLTVNIIKDNDDMYYLDLHIDCDNLKAKYMLNNGTPEARARAIQSSALGLQTLEYDFFERGKIDWTPITVLQINPTKLHDAAVINYSVFQSFKTQSFAVRASIPKTDKFTLPRIETNIISHLSEQALFNPESNGALVVLQSDGKSNSRIFSDATVPKPVQYFIFSEQYGYRRLSLVNNYMGSSSKFLCFVESIKIVLTIQPGCKQPVPSAPPVLYSLNATICELAGEISIPGNAIAKENGCIPKSKNTNTWKQLLVEEKLIPTFAIQRMDGSLLQHNNVTLKPTNVSSMAIVRMLTTSFAGDKPVVVDYVDKP